MVASRQVLGQALQGGQEVICARCEKDLLKPARVIKTKGEPLYFGRACAIKVGLLTPRPKPAKLVTAHEFDEERQLTLEWTDELFNRD